MFKKTKVCRANLIYTFCNTSQGRMRAACKSSKSLLVCLGAQIVLQANMDKPRIGLNVLGKEKTGTRDLFIVVFS